MIRFGFALMGLLALVVPMSAADVRLEAQLRLLQQQLAGKEATPPPTKYENLVKLGKIQALGGWEFEVIAPGEFAIYSPEGHCNKVVGDPVFVYQHGPDKQVSGKVYGAFRRAVERIDLGNGVHLIVITVGEGRKEGRGYADEAVFISAHGVLEICNMWSNDGKATAYRRSCPQFVSEVLAGRLGSELASDTDYKEWLYFLRLRAVRIGNKGKSSRQAAAMGGSPPTAVTGGPSPTAATAGALAHFIQQAPETLLPVIGGSKAEECFQLGPLHLLADLFLQPGRPATVARTAYPCRSPPAAVASDTTPGNRRTPRSGSPSPPRGQRDPACTGTFPSRFSSRERKAPLATSKQTRPATVPSSPTPRC